MKCTQAYHSEPGVCTNSIDDNSSTLLNIKYGGFKSPRNQGKFREKGMEIFVSTNFIGLCIDILWNVGIIFASSSYG